MENCRLLPLALAMGIYAMGLNPAFADDDDSAASNNATIFVQTMAPAEKTLPRQMTAYGTVIPDIGDTVNIVVPRPGQVTKLMVNPGEQVKSGQNLFELATSAATRLAYQQAASAQAFARTDLARIQELFKEKLATLSQLAAAEKALADAGQALQAQEKIGADKTTQWITSPADAVVTEVTAKVGARMDQGGTVLQLNRRGAVQVDLGVEPEQLGQVRPGMPVTVTSVFDDNHPVSGRISKLHAIIDPQTRLVGVIVQLDAMPAGGMLPGMRVEGVITLAMVKSWVVPRRAVLSDSEGAYVFQVKDGKAVRVKVRIALDQDDIYGIEGRLDPKAPLVTLGNYELSDGQKVRTTETSAKSPAGKAGAD